MKVHDPLSLVCGDTWAFTVPVADADGNALNLTGASATWKLDDQSGATNALTLTIGDGLAVETFTAWAQLATHNAGDRVANGGNAYVALQGGVTNGGGTGPNSRSTGVLDGTVVWDYDGPAAGIAVTVSAARSGGVAPGNYSDWLRVTLADGTVLTQWTGVIRAEANPA